MKPSAGRRLPGRKEAAIQEAVLRFLRLDRRVAWAQRFNTGAHVVEGVGAGGRRTRRYIRYAFPGCSDLLGQLVDGRFLAVECKAARGRATEAQEAFLDTVGRHGGVAVLARSVEDVAAALDTAQARPCGHLATEVRPRDPSSQRHPRGADGSGCRRRSRSAGQGA